jgi:hypothetical protein
MDEILRILNEHEKRIADLEGRVEELEEAEEARLTHQRERKRKLRLKQAHNLSRDSPGTAAPYPENLVIPERVSSGGLSRDSDSVDLPFILESKLDSTTSIRKESCATKKNNREANREFDEIFWPAYPHKVGKDAAIKSWLKARERADLETIMDGLKHYKADKPKGLSWCNPSTWLNQGRWKDRPDYSDYHFRAHGGVEPYDWRKGF